MSRHVSGAAAHVAYFAFTRPRLAKRLSSSPVEWLAIKLVINPPGVFVGDLVVTLADRTCMVVSHGGKTPARLFISSRIEEPPDLLPSIF